jgi:DUF1009 family protein
MKRRDAAGRAPPPAGETAPLMILAAGGSVPLHVAEAAVGAGRSVFVMALAGEADERLAAYPHAFIKWGEIGRVLELARDKRVRDVVLIGSVSKRPDFRDIGFDMATIRYLPRILKSLTGGDDTVLGRVVQVLEEEGLRVIGAHEVAPDLVAAPGRLAGPEASAADLADAGAAMLAARAIGELDIGQAAIAVAERVVALEAAEGTDAIIERVGTLRRSGRFKWQGRSGVLAKCAKPRQDLRVDMPTVGPRTVELVAAAGLAGIVIEAGKVMLAERTATIAAAERTGTFIRAIASSGPAS